MWIERAHATLKDHPELPFTVEIACGLLKKAAVCWLAVAGDDDALRAFERAAVILDGETLSALVPPPPSTRNPPERRPGAVQSRYSKRLCRQSMNP